jgi:molybdopterin/thiamine biosynthesis adenylyltransferase
MKIYTIGAGGTASYLLPVLARTLQIGEKVDEVIIIDRDVVEEKNVERQLFEYEEVGSSKASLLASGMSQITPLKITAKTEWFVETTEVMPHSFMISCTDNHPARLALLNVCDELECSAVICGNETFSADAYYYEPCFRDTPLDPRVRYPEILTDKADDPTRPPCNDANALAENPQLAAANMMSAALGMHLVQLWLFEIDRYDLSECLKYLPVELSSTATCIKTVKYGDLIKEK